MTAATATAELAAIEPSEDALKLDFRYGCEFYNMLWGYAGRVAIGQVIPAYNRTFCGEDEIPISPAMARAGKRAWVDWCDHPDNPEMDHWLVVYRAMERVRRSEALNVRAPAGETP